MLKCARKASLKGVSGFIWRRLQAAPLFSKYAKSDIKESAGRKMAALRRERSENEAKNRDSTGRAVLNFPAFNAGSVMKMAAEKLVSYESFARLSGLKSLYFKVWENISWP